ncbi:rifin [Plasmodium falciparum NF54]|uniref:Rifin n=2 Tax=Plasmodium falciparum TaxID=5833 RepID=O96293_PLAF7|nr:rifin [Plasmodium falciparum 3D7]KAF4331283.1 rifin [Plasmodium falciparum NF54]PKC46277.1 rifin [Plasmodium falciparum NF54]CZT98244.1 rifin [Plasmodium falciparum 3D7]|eukprot:XP_001349734.1 rifin [Plasmodium falciparum 3D7]
MKLHFPKILLFFFPSNILLTSYHVHSKNKPYITPRHTPTITSRVLRECDIHKSIYDNDEDMKSVKENFDRQISQRFEEYEERMKGKRQKRKEERDKNIQEIIEKDRMDKSLAEKVEKCCLICGCGLGGVAASVGIFGGIAISELKKAAMIAAIASAQKTGVLAGEAARIPAGIKAVIAGLKRMGISTLGGKDLGSYFATTDYTNFKTIARVINSEYQTDSCLIGGPATDKSKTICNWVRANFVAPQDSPGKGGSVYKSIETAVKSIVTDAETVAQRAVENATEEVIKNSTAAAESTYAGCQTAIIASVVAIIIIALVMIIIYLVLRYRRKKKMKKKAEYTKLLNQ